MKTDRAAPGSDLGFGFGRKRQLDLFDLSTGRRSRPHRGRDELSWFPDATDDWVSPNQSVQRSGGSRCK